MEGKAPTETDIFSKILIGVLVVLTIYNLVAYVGYKSKPHFTNSLWHDLNTFHQEHSTNDSLAIVKLKLEIELKKVELEVLKKYGK